MSSVSSGWNDATRNRPSRSNTGTPSMLGEHLHVGPRSCHPGRADEDAVQRLLFVGQDDVGLEARELSAVAVPFNLEIDETEVGAIEQDHPRAGAEDWPGEAADRLLEPVELHQPHDRRRLAARDHEPVETLELLRQAHLDDARPKPSQHRRVLAEVSLQGEDADLHSAIVGGLRSTPRESAPAPAEPEARRALVRSGSPTRRRRHRARDTRVAGPTCRRLRARSGRTVRAIRARTTSR